MALFCDNCGEMYTRKEALEIFVSLQSYDPEIPIDAPYSDYKNLCGDCAYKKAYEDYHGEPYKSDEEIAEESDDYDPDCPYNDWYDNDESSNDEEDNESLSAEDAALIYMSSGEDEDYDFSDGGIDTSRYKDE